MALAKKPQRSGLKVCLNKLDSLEHESDAESKTKISTA